VVKPAGGRRLLDQRRPARRRRPVEFLRGRAQEARGVFSSCGKRIEQGAVHRSDSRGVSPLARGAQLLALIRR